MSAHKGLYLAASVVMLAALLLPQGAAVSAPRAPADSPISFTEHTIDGEFDGAHSVYATDVDGDGDIDVLGAAQFDDDITWWENDGNESFTARTIATEFDGARSVFATDLDGDGDVDVLGAAHYASDIAWWENDGNESFTKHTIDWSFQYPAIVYATDVDGDDDVDVLGAAMGADEIAWWENDGSENFSKHSIDSSYEGAACVYATDVDGDGDVDVLGTAEQAGDITWWQNDGSEHFTERTIDGNFDSAASVYATDVDGDGDVDVLGAARFSTDEIAWWENDGNESFTKHIIDGNFDGADAVYAADVDGDGDVDVLGAAESADEIAWWENDGSESFTRHTIAADFNTAYAVYATDVDGDGDVDVLGAAFYGDDITWWEQVPSLSLDDVSVVEGDSGTVDAVFSATLSVTSTEPITVEYATADGSATAPADYTAISSATLTFAPGVATQVITVSVRGDTLDEPDETFFVNLANPVNIGIGDSQGEGTILDDDMPLVQFSSTSYSVGEAEGLATITATLDTASWQVITVDYATADGTATAGQDYTAVSGTLSFDPGIARQTFTVPILNDTLDETSETISLTLSNPTSCTLRVPEFATLTIRDDDGVPIPIVAFSSATYDVDEGNGSALIVVALDVASTLTATVDYATSDGSATAGDDYTAISGTLIFKPGVISQTFAVSLLDDALEEENETAMLNLFDPTNVDIGGANPATLIITDDDGQPSVRFSAADYTVSEAEGSAAITVTLSNPYSLTVTADYVTADGTAIAGSDYISTSGTLTFTPGITNQMFTISILDDALSETDEDVGLALNNATNATLGTLSSAILTILDDDTSIYLPLILRHWPIIPDVPILDPISNPEGDGNYVVSWNAVSGATGYTLEEDDNAAFSSPTIVYSGPNTTVAITGKDVGTYYYRVKASNAYGSSGWSEAVSVAVTVPPPLYDWTLLPTTITQTLEAVYFIDPQTGWVAGDDGTILHTTDAGLSWQRQGSGTTMDLHAIFFLDLNRGWIVGGDRTPGVILRTTDGGNTWETQARPASTWFQAVQFTDEDHGWIGGGHLSARCCPWEFTAYGYVLRSTDGGDSWSLADEISNRRVTDLHFVDTMHGWLTTEYIDNSNGNRIPGIYVTSDGGSTWTNQSIPLATGILEAVTFVDANTGWAVGDAGAILNTTNGGALWNRQDSGTTSDLAAVQFVSPTTGWVVGSILHTMDGGDTWSPQNADPACTGLHDVYFIDTDHGWAVGENGVVCKYH